jgi:hypothetical protein
VRRSPLLYAIVLLVALALVIGACSGDDDAKDNPSAKPSASEKPPSDGRNTQPSAGQLPPEFTKCMAEQGYPIKSLDEIHSAPQQVLQACFGALHGGGGAP